MELQATRKVPIQAGLKGSNTCRAIRDDRIIERFAAMLPFPYVNVFGRNADTACMTGMTWCNPRNCQAVALPSYAALPFRHPLPELLKPTFRVGFSFAASILPTRKDSAAVRR
jgi:hypothetical protein